MTLYVFCRRASQVLLLVAAALMLPLFAGICLISAFEMIDFEIMFKGVVMAAGLAILLWLAKQMLAGAWEAGTRLLNLVRSERN